MSHLLTAPRVVAGERLLAPGWVLIEEGAIVDVGEGEPPRHVGDPTTVLTEGVLAPGLVDIQLNGAFGVDFGADDADWGAVARRLPSTGVTAFVPTLITAPVEDLVAALVRHRSWQAAPGAARPLGVHLEGPFLAERRRGAHRADLLCDPRPELVDGLLEAAGGYLAYLTLAPERRGALDAIRRLTASGTRVAVGHTDADERTVRAAADAGATLVTHLYNAQRPLRHRDPGTVGAALADDRLTSGLIADLHHVVPAAIRIAFRAAPGRIALVTDAVAAMGMPPGTYVLAGEPVDVRPGEPPRRADGVIAGSTLRMDAAVANAVRRCDVDLVTAVDAASRIPAAAVGRDDLGTIAAGRRADLVWLDDELIARATWIDGEPAWSREHVRVAT